MSYSKGFKAPNYAEIFVWAELADPVDLSAFEAFCAPYGVPCGFDQPTEIRAVPNESLGVEKIESYELGYRGVIGSAAYLTVDLYRSEIKDLLSNLIPMVNSRLGWISSSYDPYKPPDDLPQEASAALMATLSASLPPELFNVLSNAPDGRPLFAAYSGTNFGNARAWGAELGLGFKVHPRWNVDVSYTYFDHEILDQLDEDPLFPNAAENRFSVSVAYRDPRWTGTLQYRRVDTFPWRTGIYWGQVPAFDTLTLSVGFLPTPSWRIGVDVENLLDDAHYQQFGGDVLRRRAVGFVARDW